MLARTNVVIDTDLIEEAGRLTGLKTKKDVISYALQELVQQRRRSKLLSIRHAGLWDTFGTPLGHLWGHLWGQA